MRLAILENGHGLGSKVLFAIIRLASGLPVLDVIKLAKYRPAFYGDAMGALTQQAMRGASTWSIGDRELMAAIVAQANECAWCTTAHREVASAAFQDAAKVAAVVADIETASIGEPLRATLRMLQKLTRAHVVDANDMRAVLAAGASRQQIEDALAVCFAFNVTGRLADAFGFAMASDASFKAGAKYLLARGYR